MNFLVKLIGFPATLIHGDTMVLDRWFWLKKRTKEYLGSKPNKILDVGCGSGAFTIGLSNLGYKTLGLSWDKANQEKGKDRAKLCKADKASFEVMDVRELGMHSEHYNTYDAVIALEVLEHIIDDVRLIKSMSKCLKPGGKIFITSPNFNKIPYNNSAMEAGPFLEIEDGRHVRQGYTVDSITNLATEAGLKINKIEFLSGVLSQKITKTLNVLITKNHLIGWLLILPLRIFPILFDSIISNLIKRPGYTICLIATKSTN